MGRQTLQMDLELPEEEPVPAAPERRPRARGAAVEPRRVWRDRLRRIAIWTAGVAAAAGAVVGVYQVDEFLARDAHFVLPLKNLRVEGLEYASREAVLRVFAPDIGRSIYLMPLSARRRSLLTIDWVRDASVSRRWPDGVLVSLQERVPVAFVVLQGEPLGLIDAAGVILSWPARAQLNLPVLRGIARQQPQPLRARRVSQMLEMMRQVQSYAGQISEIDAADPDNLTVTQTVQGRAVRLLLGDRNYLPRMRNFLTHYPEIGRRLPAARIFDLRLDDRITVRPAEEEASPSEATRGR